MAARLGFTAALGAFGVQNRAGADHLDAHRQIAAGQAGSQR
jgi:hypothetical protein